MVASESLNKSDLQGLYGIVQNTMLSYPKKLIVDILKESFSKDSWFHYVSDEWGFSTAPKSHLNQPLTTGLYDDSGSRLFIGENFPYNQKYYPAILVKGGSFRYVPISFNRNKFLVQYKSMRFVDGYGNVKIFSIPDYYDMAGAWEGDIVVDIYAGDVSARDELTELVAGLIEIIHHDELIKSGVFTKPCSIGAPTEKDDSKDKLYCSSITLPIRTEWRRRIPIKTVIDRINLCVEIGNLGAVPFVPAADMTIHDEIDINDKVFE